MTEYWHPLGPVGVISAFNFPVAVWAWNAMIGLVCGDPIVWKPSEKTPLSRDGMPANRADGRSARRRRRPGISSVVDRRRRGRPGTGRVAARAADFGDRVSVPMGRAVAKTVAARLGRSLLELGGNNGMIVTPSADLQSGGAGDRVRRGRHLRPALHDAAPA